MFIIVLAVAASCRRRHGDFNRQASKENVLRISKIGAVLLLAIPACVPAGAQTETPKCNVPVFRGAARPQGGDAEMRIVNNGQACGIRNYGLFAEPATLAFAGEITVAPKHGVARFEPPRALYTPSPGFVGEDSFEYRANAKGPNDSPVLLKARVKVIVTAE